MKKILILMFMAFMLISMCSCSISDIIWGDAIWDEQRSDTVYYGVGYHIGDLNNTCVFIPYIGHVAMPCTEDGECTDFKAGDIIKITFSGNEDLAILESYPAQFGSRAKEVRILDANVGLEWADDAFLITLDMPNNVSDVKVGDELVMKTKKTDGDQTVLKDFASFTVENVWDGRMTLSFDVSADEVLETIFNSEYRFDKQ